MYKVLVFAGTTEGYEICRFLADHKIETKGFVATEYGSKSLTENEFLTVQTGRLDAAAMEETFLQEKPEMVLDATHPYAAEVTVNIRTACENTQTAYYRVLREAGEHENRAVYVDSVKAAADYLDQTRGNVLLTTGSKELAGFTGMKDYQNRLYARVLSLPNVMKACAELGFEGKHLIGMQGPFSRELNAAMLRQYDCRYLVTKDTGKAGGFQDKIDAALECDAVPVIIGRPLKEEGMSVRECKRFLTEHFSLAHRPHITLLGIGMGSQKLLTVQGKNSLEQADLLIGARRMVDSVKRPGQDVFVEYRWTLWFVAAVSVVTFVMFGIDKYRAVKGGYRIPIAVLLGMAFAGGSIGALLGMVVFRHKIRKNYFSVGVPLILVMQVVLLMCVVNLL